MYEQEQFPTMCDREKYLFDLQGFLVVKKFLSDDEVETLNKALDANLDKRGEFGEPNVLSGQWENKPLEGKFSPISSLQWNADLGSALVSTVSKSASSSEIDSVPEHFAWTRLEIGPWCRCAQFHIWY